MSTTIEIIRVGVPEREVTRATEMGRRLAQKWESRFSRFQPDSQLCRLNAAGGAAVRVEDDVLDLLETVKAAVRRTGGRFDPYRTFLPSRQPGTTAASSAYGPSHPASPAIPPSRGWTTRLATRPHRPRSGSGSAASWDAHRSRRRGKGRVRRPTRARAPLLAGRLYRRRRRPARLGHSARRRPLACRHRGPIHPETEVLVADVRISSSVGVATSGTYRRRWSTGERMVHHLIDPSSGAPLADEVRSLTAFASDVTSAEVASKAMMVAAPESSVPELFRHSCCRDPR